jgi:ribosomal protein L11 methyltransferase
LARTYPALDVRWAAAPDEDTVGRLLAEIDAEHPLAIDPQPDGVRLFFQLTDQRDRASGLIARMDPPAASAPVDVPDEDWAARSQASLGPVTIDRLVVTPPWARAAVRADAIEVIVLPSMGFGTGHHASTRLCLTLLQRVRVTGARVLDVGTGSAVLAIAAARLGAVRILAVDSDPDAILAASENVDLNGAGDAVEVRLMDLGLDVRPPGEPFDLVLANLTGALLVRHAATLRRLVDADGRAILSGFEKDEAETVQAAFEAAGFLQADRTDEEGWVGLLVRASPTPSTAR